MTSVSDVDHMPVSEAPPVETLSRLKYIITKLLTSGAGKKLTSDKLTSDSDCPGSH
jgi:hypothetical protein